MKRPAIIAGVVLISTGLTGGVYYARQSSPTSQVVTKPITRGDIVKTVSATGTLEAVKTVQVGTQVSGTVEALFADFNSVVHKDQVVARLDPDLFQSQVEQAQANLIKSEADVERLRVGLDDARTKLARAQELWDSQLIPKTELEAAEVNTRSADAQLHSAQAQVTQARAALNQTQVNLDKIVITSPIDGVVIARNVDVGQTVAASLQAPTLFEIAADLTKMQVKASISEADVGNIQAGQTVTFQVDAFPGQTFTGTVSQVRLAPVVEQNVVTYAGIIDVRNADLKLRPGMTAMLTVEVARRRNVLRAPNAALQFKPTAEMLSVLGAPAAAAATRSALGAGQTASQADPQARERAVQGGPRPASENIGRLWTESDGQLVPIPVRLGMTDGVYTELLSANVQEGANVVTNVLEGKITNKATAATNRNAGNPLLGMQPGSSGRFGAGMNRGAAGVGARQ
jgi:HlyD family secretion protein